MGKAKTSKRRYKSGEKAPVSGGYEIVGPRGGGSGIMRYVTRGDPMPPVPRAGDCYVLVNRIETGRTSAVSTVILDDATRKYQQTLIRLAEK